MKQKNTAKEGKTKLPFQKLQQLVPQMLTGSGLEEGKEEVQIQIQHSGKHAPVPPF